MTKDEFRALYEGLPVKVKKRKKDLYVTLPCGHYDWWYVDKASFEHDYVSCGRGECGCDPEVADKANAIYAVVVERRGGEQVVEEAIARLASKFRDKS